MNLPPSPTPLIARPDAVRPEPATLPHACASRDAGPEEEEVGEEYDPHPDTPDDFDEDTSWQRQSVEAVVGEAPSGHGLPGGLSAQTAEAERRAAGPAATVNCRVATTPGRPRAGPS
jgi:hypothetical protein